MEVGGESVCSSSTSSFSSTPMTDYEKKRLDNIQKNKLKLASLNISSSSSFKTRESAAAANRKTFSEKKTPKRPHLQTNSPQVVRRSLRARGVPPDPERGPDPDVVSSSSLHSFDNNDASSSLDSPRKKTTPFPLSQVYEGRSEEKKFTEVIDRVRETTVFRGPGRCCNAKEEDGDHGLLELGKMSLKAGNVARVVPSRIFSVGFFPTAERRIVVVGGKLGHLGFWDVDYCNTSTDGDDNNGEGVYAYCPHSAPVSAVVIPQFTISKVYSSSYDRFIRMMDIEKEMFSSVYAGSEEIFSLAQNPDDTQSLFFGEGGGELKIWDLRAAKVSMSQNLHEQRINSIDFNPKNTNLIALSSTDGTASIWDLRSLTQKKPISIQTMKHERVVQSAYFSPSGNFLATTSTDNRIGLLHGADYGETDYIHHNNQTSRWISSFRAIWGWDDRYLFVGNIRRAVDVISTSSASIRTSLDSPLITAIPCRFAAHPYSVGTLAGTTGGGQVYLWTMT